MCSVSGEKLALAFDEFQKDMKMTTVGQVIYLLIGRENVECLRCGCQISSIDFHIYGVTESPTPNKVLF
jgi:hypothetical protein